MKTQNFLWLILTGALAGCVSAPTVSPSVQVDVPQRFQAASASAQDLGPLTEKWWLQMHDAGLQKMVEVALAESPAIPVSLARVQRARAELAGAQAERRPILGFAVSSSYDRSSENTLSGAARGHESVRGHTNTVGLQASWEPDLWGRLSSQTKINQLGLEMAQIDAQSVRLMLAADIASAYFQCRAAQAEIEVLKRTHARRQGQLEILDARYKAGLVNELDVARTRVEIANTQADIVETERRQTASERALQELMGVNDFTPYRGYCQSIEALPEPLPLNPGVPAQLLGRRPDLAKSMLRLAQKLYKEHIAKTAYYPSIALVGAYGYASTELRDLVKSSSGQFSVGPLSLYLPIFEGGRIAARIATTRAEYAEEYTTHRQLLLNALREVDDALSNLKYQDLYLQERLVATNMALQVVDLARARYQKGLVSYLDVIDAERSLLAAERSAVQSKAALLASNISLIRALGGGWADQPHEVAMR